MKRTLTSKRRATVLLMVVSLLALLFIIVTGFLSLARAERQVQRLVRTSNRVDAIVDDSLNVLRTRLAEAITDADGRVLSSGGAGWASIPGYGKHAVVASIDPVVDYGRNALGIVGVNGSDELSTLTYPALTLAAPANLSRPVGQPFGVLDLLLENHTDTDISGGLFLDYDDIIKNALEPFMDADGNGMPDAAFMNNALLFDQANASAGTLSSISGLDLKPASIPSPGTIAQSQWQSILNGRRYDVAARVIANGGLITLNAADPDTWNRKFQERLFDSLKHPQDMISLRTLTDRDTIFEQLALFSGPVETALRRRNGLPGLEFQVGGTDRSRIAPVLSRLSGQIAGQQGFEYSLLPRMPFDYPMGGTSRAETWQRINLADDLPGNGQDNDRRAFVLSSTIDTTVYNSAANATALQNARRAYNFREHLTVMNYSDDLALKQKPGVPPLARPPYSSVKWRYPAQRQVPTKDFVGLGLFEGERKFWLGDVATSFTEVSDTVGLFAHSPASGKFRYVRSAVVVPQNEFAGIGSAVVERLASYYQDMLFSHSGWLDPNLPLDQLGGDYQTSDDDRLANREPTSIRDQALMLAVNTVAFASPRDSAPDTRGFVDLVTYVEKVPDRNPNDPASHRMRRFVGYGPQPVISEVVVYREDDGSGGQNAQQTSMAVELYNPNDAHYVGTEDMHALLLEQFAISINDAVPPRDYTTAPTAGVVQLTAGSTIRVPQTNVTPLPQFSTPRRHLDGRSFFTVVIHEQSAPNGPTPFDTLPGPAIKATISPDQIEADNNPQQNDKITIGASANLIAVNLWRRGRGVDLLNNTKFDNWVMVDRVWVEEPGPVASPGSEWRAVHRDATPNFNFGIDPTAPVNPSALARWNMMTAKVESDSGSNSVPPLAALGAATWLKSGAAFNPDDPANFATLPFSPTTPLILMNAGKVNTGDAREPVVTLNDLSLFGDSNDTRPRSFPTPGFLLFVPRFSHMDFDDPEEGGPKRYVPMSAMLRKAWKDSPTTEKDINTYPADFGHMPIFDNTQNAPAGTYVANIGRIPWGLLVFDYFTTLNPDKPGVDPLRIPGRIDINSAPWPLLSRVPLIGPATGGPASGALPILSFVLGRNEVGAPATSFWSGRAGVLHGFATSPLAAPTPNPNAPRLFHAYSALNGAWASAPGTEARPFVEDVSAGQLGLWRLGGVLAQAAAAYRDGVQYVDAAVPYDGYASAHLRNRMGQYDASNFLASAYRPGTYGPLRGETIATPARGFATIGELVNVRGWDSSRPAGLAGGVTTLAQTQRDFVKAVSLLALIDSHQLTTRSNTYTLYVSVMDRENPEASVRAQMTVDRTNLLPRLTYEPSSGPVPSTPWATFVKRPVLANMDGEAPGTRDDPFVFRSSEKLPAILAERRTSYFNAKNE
jgi:hypothetical protein